MRVTLQPVWTGVLFFAALGSSLISGVFFAFSTFVMRALARLPAPQGIAAMQSINITAINPLFMGVFFGTAALSIILMIAFWTRWREPAILCLFLGSLLYLVGVLLVTIVFNVPRNDALAPLDPHSAEAASLWSRYVSEWTAWNHVRTVAALAAAAAFVMALRTSSH
ncbi:MAG: DUF1772 domain-containing protein [Cytophagales bacterium]|nr:DUF1772 domain-containing protein [Armatimonadota bacterium]